MNRKIILCYGDSNTFGYCPADGRRYPREIRWTGRLAGKLGDGYQVIEAGLNSRTTVIDDDLEEDRNGLTAISMVTEMSWPLDLIILMLGTNDMKERYRMEAEDIAEGARALIRRIRELHEEKCPDWMPQILLISPILIGEGIRDGISGFSESFGKKRAYDLSRKLAPLYRKVAEEEKCLFLDAAAAASAGMQDALHLEEEGHRMLAEAVERTVRDIFEKKNLCDLTRHI